MFIFKDLRSTSQAPSLILTDEEVEECRSDLIEYYEEVLGGIHTDAFDPDSRHNFDDIYTNLFLLEDENRRGDHENHDSPRRHPYFQDQDRGRPRKWKHLPDDEFRKLVSPGKRPYRIMLVGEAGVGKTTFLAKLANDWKLGREFQEIKLLFHIPLRKAKKANIFGNIVQEYLSERRTYGERLDNYINKNQNKVMLLLDGLNEFQGEITGNISNDVLAKIMGGKKYKECVVIITTRPWRADKIMDLHFTTRFTSVSVEGFTKESMYEYAEKFFHSSQAVAESLKLFLADDNEQCGIFSTIMAPFPIFMAMLCHVWER